MSAWWKNETLKPQRVIMSQASNLLWEFRPRWYKTREFSTTQGMASGCSAVRHHKSLETILRSDCKNRSGKLNEVAPEGSRWAWIGRPRFLAQFRTEKKWATRSWQSTCTRPCSKSITVSHSLISEDHSNPAAIPFLPFCWMQSRGPFETTRTGGGGGGGIHVEGLQ